MDVQNNAVLDIVCRDAYWIAFSSFVLMRPALHILPTIRLSNTFLNLAVSAAITMIIMFALLMLPLLMGGYLPVPRNPEFRQAYFWGLISGGVMTHGLWWLLIKLSVLDRRQDGRA